MPKAAGAKKTKLQVVKEILERGITKASEIVAAAKQVGVEISEATASNYKHQLGMTSPRKKRGGTGEKTTTKKVALVKRTSTGVSTDLELENLALRFIVKAGGYEAARDLLERYA